MSEHTKTPWHNKGLDKSTYNHEIDIVCGPDGCTVARVEIYGFGNEEAQANAQFIVKAVNAHEELVEALRAMYNVKGNVGRMEKALIKAEAILVKLTED